MSAINKSLVRMAILSAAAVGYMFPDSAAVASAACKACVEADCTDVQGGATHCLEESSGQCSVFGDLCNS